MRAGEGEEHQRPLDRRVVQVRPRLFSEHGHQYARKRGTCPPPAAPQGAPATPRTANSLQNCMRPGKDGTTRFASAPLACQAARSVGVTRARTTAARRSVDRRTGTGDGGQRRPPERPTGPREAGGSKGGATSPRQSAMVESRAGAVPLGYAASSARFRVGA